MPKGIRKPRAPLTPEQESWVAVRRIVELSVKLQPEDLAVVISKLTKRAEAQPQ